MNEMLMINKLKKEFSNNGVKKIALNGLTFHLNEGEIINIVGHNGSGKTTLLKLISKDLDPTSGNIYFYESDISQYSKYEWSLLLGKVYQNPLLGLVSNFSVFENLELYSLKNQKLRLFSNIYKIRKKLIKEEFFRLKSNSGINFNFSLDNKVSKLSGGQKQLVSLLALYFQKPKIIILDEPTASLDDENSKKFLNFLSYWIENERLSALMVCHQEKFVITNNFRILFLNEGAITNEFTSITEYNKFKINHLARN